MEMPTTNNLKLIILLLLIQTTLSLSKTENDEFDEELYSVIDSVRDGSLWTKHRHVRSVEQPSNNQTFSFSDNSLWNDLWFECGKRTSFACIKSGVFKYLDKSLEINHDVEITDQLWFRRNTNKYNGYCENSDEGKDSCLKYNQEKQKLLEASDKKSKVEGSSSIADAGRRETNDKENHLEPGKFINF